MAIDKDGYNLMFDLADWDTEDHLINAIKSSISITNSPKFKKEVGDAREQNEDTPVRVYIYREYDDDTYYYQIGQS